MESKRIFSSSKGLTSPGPAVPKSLPATSRSPQASGQGGSGGTHLEGAGCFRRKEEGTDRPTPPASTGPWLPPTWAQPKPVFSAANRSISSSSAGLGLSPVFREGSHLAGSLIFLWAWTQPSDSSSLYSSSNAMLRRTSFAFFLC